MTSLDEIKNLEELALRLLSFTDYREDGRLLVGQVSKLLPPEVIFPEGCRIIGSFERGENYAAVIYDTNLIRKALCELYEAHMFQNGWFYPKRRISSGFDPWNDDDLPVIFCKGPQGPTLSLEIKKHNDNITQVRMVSDLDPSHSYCATRGRYELDTPERFMPTLSPPPGLAHHSVTGGGSNRSRHSETLVQTEIRLESIAAHYAHQLQGGGWLPVANGQVGSCVWSSWNVLEIDGKKWQGMFFAVERQNRPRQVWMLVTIALEEDI